MIGADLDPVSTPIQLHITRGCRPNLMRLCSAAIYTPGLFYTNGREPSRIELAIATEARFVPLLRIDADRRTGDGDWGDTRGALSSLFVVFYGVEPRPGGLYHLR
jgi:hypothetical protein